MVVRSAALRGSSWSAPVDRARLGGARLGDAPNRLACASDSALSRKPVLPPPPATKIRSSLPSAASTNSARNSSDGSVCQVALSGSSDSTTSRATLAALRADTSDEACVAADGHAQCYVVFADATVAGAASAASLTDPPVGRLQPARNSGMQTAKAGDASAE